MKTLSSIDDVPAGKYRDIATIYVSTEEVERLTGASFVDTFDDLDYCKQAYFSDDEEGVILTSYRGFQEKSCVLASNREIDQPDLCLMIILKKLGIEPRIRYILMGEGAQFD